MSRTGISFVLVLGAFLASPVFAQDKVLPPSAPMSLPDLMEQDVPEHPRKPAEPVAPEAPTQPVLPQKPAPGMHHVKVRDGSAPTKTRAPEQQKQAEKSSVSKEDTQTPPISASKVPDKIPNSANPAKQEVRSRTTPNALDYFVPIDQTQIWPHTAALISTRNATQLKSTLEKTEQDLAQLPPTTLVLAANGYVQQGDLKRAAELYYLAQLRAQVDAQRWPKASGRKTAQAELSALLDAYGPAITHWAMADSQRLEGVIRDVIALDNATSYRYHPGFVPEPENDAPDWQAAHKKGQLAFQTETSKVIEALHALKR